MLNVSDATKKIYQQDSVEKTLRIVFPNLGLEYTNSDLIMESFSWQESVFEGNGSSGSIEFVGCIASMIKFDIVDRVGALASINGELIEAYIKALDTDEIQLFTGYVESAVRTAQQYTKSITAYDELKGLADIDVTEWYKAHEQCTINTLLADLLDYLHITNRVGYLINGWMTAFCKESKRIVQKLSALNLLKAICQINGCCGRLNRQGEFEVVYLDTTLFNVPYPSMSLFPMATLFPHKEPVTHEEAQLMTLDVEEEVADDDSKVVQVSYYKRVNYEDYNVSAIDKVTIRNKSDDTGVSAGTGENNYIVQGNLFAYEQPESVLHEAADLLLLYNEKFEYTPFESDNNGLPFLECGDGVIYYDIDYEPTGGGRSLYAEPQQIERKFCILSREISGIQSLRDNYNASGDKNQTTMISDIGVEVSDIDNQIADINESVDKLTSDVGKMLKAVSVSSIPTNWDSNTIYFLRK